MELSRTERRKKKKRFRFKRIFLIFILIFSFAPLCYGGYLLYTINAASEKSYYELDRTKSKYRIDEVEMGKDPVSILLVGVEDYLGDNGRSDALILVTLNPKTSQIAILSIPRDTRTYIEVRKKEDKINHAYAFGGLNATIQSVEDLLKIPVDYYIETNLNGFQDIVDELGGIKVNVPFNFKQSGMDGKMIYFSEGEMELDGREALAFVQMRKEDPRGDFGRQERQQIALKAIADKALSINSVTKADNIINTVSDNTRTNIPLTELLGLRNFYNEIKNQDFDVLKLEGENKTINRVYYFVPDAESLKNISLELKRILEVEEE